MRIASLYAPDLTVASVPKTPIIPRSVIFNAARAPGSITPRTATGIAAHGIGTARAFQVNQEAGAFAALGMGLNGILTAVLVPLLAGWIPH